MSYLGVTDRVFAALYAVEEVLSVAAAFVKMNLIGTYRRCQKRFGLGFQLAAIDVDPSFGAFEPRAATFTEKHLNAIGIRVFDFRFGRCRKQPGLGEFALTPDFHRPGIVGLVAPLCDIQMVSTPVGHLSARVFQNEPELIVTTLQMVGLPRSRPQPQVVVKAFRHRLGGPCRLTVSVIAGNADSHRVSLCVLIQRLDPYIAELHLVAMPTKTDVTFISLETGVVLAVHCLWCTCLLDVGIDNRCTV